MGFYVSLKLEGLSCIRILTGKSIFRSFLSIR